MSLFSELKTAVSKRKTEHGERNAVSSILIQYGYTAQPEIEKRKQPDNSVVRLYTWYDTPAGDVTLVAGPSVEGEVILLNPPESYTAPKRVLGDAPKPRRNKKPKTIRRPSTRAFDHHEGTISHSKEKSPYSLQPQSVRSNPIADEVKAVRALVTPIGKHYNQRVSVRKGTGSMRGSVLIRGDHNATNPALRIAILKALMNAGYEEFVGGTDLAGLLSLSEDWNHAEVNFAVHKTSKGKSVRSNPTIDPYDGSIIPDDSEEVEEVRKLVESFNKYGPTVRVREGFRDTEGMVNVYTSDESRRYGCGTQISIIKKLAKAGYEPRKFYGSGFAVSKAENIATPLRSNPPKGPQKKDLYSLESYSEEPFGIQGVSPLTKNFDVKTSSIIGEEKASQGDVPYYTTVIPAGTDTVYWGDIIESVADNYKGYDYAIGASIIRFFIRNVFGITPKQVKVSVHNTWLADIDLDTPWDADKENWLTDEQASGLREAFMIAGNYMYKENKGRFELDESYTMKSTKGPIMDHDPGADYAYQGAGGWEMPAKYANYVAALTASALKANGIALTTEGEQRLKTASAKKGWSTKPGLKKKAPGYKFEKKESAAGKAKKKWAKLGEDAVVLNFARYPDKKDESVLWVTGPTYELKDSVLKPAGFAWSGNYGKTKYGVPKKVWYVFVKGNSPNQKLVAHGNSYVWSKFVENLIPKISSEGGTVDFVWDDVNGEIDDSPIQSGVFLGEITGHLQAKGLVYADDDDGFDDSEDGEDGDPLDYDLLKEMGVDELTFLDWLKTLGPDEVSSDLRAFMRTYYLQSDLGFKGKDVWFKYVHRFTGEVDWWKGWENPVKLSGTLGTNPGQRVKIGDFEYYAKWAEIDSEAAAALINENVANHLYRAMGIKASDSRLGMLYIEDLGAYRLALFSPWLKHDMFADDAAYTSGLWLPFEKSTSLGGTINWRMQNYMISTLLADMLLANWDFIGANQDNVLLYSMFWKQYKTLSGEWNDSTGFEKLTNQFNPDLAAEDPKYDEVAWDMAIFRLDNGGSMGYRAQGGKKEAKYWADSGTPSPEIIDFGALLEEWVYADNKMGLYAVIKSIFYQAEKGTISDDFYPIMNIILYGKRYIQSFTETTNLQDLVKNSGVYKQTISDGSYKLNTRLKALWDEIVYPLEARIISFLNLNVVGEVATKLYSSPAPELAPVKQKAKKQADSFAASLKAAMETTLTQGQKFDVTKEAPWPPFAQEEVPVLKTKVGYRFTVVDPSFGETFFRVTAGTFRPDGSLRYALETNVLGGTYFTVTSDVIKKGPARDKILSNLLDWQAMIATLKEDNEALAETPSPIDEWDLGKIPQFGAWVDLSAPPNPLGNVFDPKDTPLVTLEQVNQIPFAFGNVEGWVIVPVVEKTLRFYTTSPSAPVQMFIVGEEDGEAGVRRIAQSSQEPQGFQTELYTQSNDGKNLLYLVLTTYSSKAATQKEVLKKTMAVVNAYAKSKISAKKFIELTPTVDASIAAPASPGGETIKVGRPWETEMPKPSMDAAGALFTDGKRVLLARRSTNQGNTKKFTSTRGGDWALPGGKIDAGETATEAALRETAEELGSIPQNKPLGIVLSTVSKTPAKLINYSTVLFYVDPTDADQWKPQIQGEHAWETDGWAWVPFTEFELKTDSKGRIKAKWTPKLHAGLGLPFEFAEGTTESIISLVGSNLSKWLQPKSVDTGGLGIPFGGLKKNPNGHTGWVDDMDQQMLLVDGELVGYVELEGDSYVAYTPMDEVIGAFPMAQDKAAFAVMEHAGIDPEYFTGMAYNPRRRNPSGYTMSGVRRAGTPGQFIEYRPRMPDGSRPRIRVSVRSPVVATQQVSTELRQYAKARKLGKKHQSKKQISSSGSLSRLGTYTGGKMIWPTVAMPKFVEAAAAIYGGKVTPKMMYENQLLQIAGLPISEVIKEAPQMIDKIESEPIKTIEEIKYQPAGKGKLTTEQKKVIKGLKNSLTQLLGKNLDLNDQTGALDPDVAAALKEKLNWALSQKKGPNYNDEKVAIYLRYLVQAKVAGLWRKYLDPGDMVLFRNVPTSGLESKTVSEIPQTRLQIEAMQKAKFWPKVGLAGYDAFEGKNRNLMAAQWLLIQSQGKAYNFIDDLGSTTGAGHWFGGQKKVENVNEGFVRYPVKKGYKVVEHEELLVPPSATNHQLVLDQKSSSADITYGKKYDLPSWINEPFANVEGFWVGWNAPSYEQQKLTVESWSSDISGYGSGRDLTIRTRACWSDNFVLIPGAAPPGWEQSFVSEREVFCVYSDYEPIPVQVIRLIDSGAGETMTTASTDTFRLTPSQIDAYIVSHPPYQQGSKIDRCVKSFVKTKKKKNPTWSEADLITFLDGGGVVTVRDLAYSFGGTSQSHSKRLQSMVQRGLLYYDKGSYGLTQDARYEAMAERYSDQDYGQDERSHKGYVSNPSDETVKLQNDFARDFAEAYSDKTGIEQDYVEGYWKSGTSLNFGPILDERYRSVSIQFGFYADAKGFGLEAFRNTPDFEDGAVPWELDGQIRMAVIQAATDLFKNYGSIDEIEEEPSVSAVSVMFGSPEEQSIFYEHMGEIAKRLGTVAGEAALEPISFDN